MNNKEGNLFKVTKNNYDKLYDLAEAVIETNTMASKLGTEVETNNTLAAKALQLQIDTAKDMGTEHLWFSEQEVQFLSVVIS